MRLLRFLVAGILFGIILTKSEVISWYRIQEMFRFDSFHMYGVIGSAVVIGALLVTFVKRTKLVSVDSKPIQIKVKPPNYVSALIGGTVFGLGWSMTGACPGPIYTLIGYGFGVYVIVLLSAVLGALAYGALRSKLPH